MRKRILVLFTVLAFCYNAAADEGMWMINAIDKALEKKMQERGLRLSAGEIYNADAEGAAISDAVVSLEFGCTGSIISDEGLMITNHHCAYSDVHSLSTQEHNYLEDGFWAMQSDQEIPIKGKKVYFLKKVLDVTSEVMEMLAEAERKGEFLGSRKLGFLMEKKYSAESGYEAWFSSMWSGTEYYVALYEVYPDVRLVAAPPVSIAAFGGDIDNWEWPQHKCDFALYRIYASPDGRPAEYSAENVPLKPARHLEISLDGYRPGDFTMVIGFPGRTDRYSSSYKVGFNENVSLPVSNRVRGDQMAIIDKWMNADPAVRLKYSDYYFSLSNVQEMNAGEVLCYRRFGVADAKRELEDRLQEWIEADASQVARYGNMLRLLGEKYSATADIERNVTYYRETLVRGTRFARIVPKINMLKSEVLRSQGISPHRVIDEGGPGQAEIACCKEYRFCGKRYNAVGNSLLKEYKGLSLDVERELLEYAVKTYFGNVDSIWFGDYQKRLLSMFTPGAECAPVSGASDFDRNSVSGCDYRALTDYIWENSFLTDEARLQGFISQEHTVDEYLSDPLCRFFNDVNIRDFNDAISAAEGEHSIYELSKDYTHALYRMYLDEGVPQYPDANSTMRITYGTVGGIEPYDGVICSWRSTADGILEKYNPEQYEFTLKKDWKSLLEKGGWGMWYNAGRHDLNAQERPEAGFNRYGKQPVAYVDFLTDNDITGGNSGSPVLDADGKLIGLAFDGNKESLASTSYYTPGYNKCVCTDIRFVLWTLDRYADMTRILDELGF